MPSAYSSIRSPRLVPHAGVAHNASTGSPSALPQSGAARVYRSSAQQPDYSTVVKRSDKPTTIAHREGMVRDFWPRHRLPASPASALQSRCSGAVQIKRVFTDTKLKTQ